jgi:hypothetical protein
MLLPSTEYPKEPSETSVPNYESIRCHNPETCNLRLSHSFSRITSVDFCLHGDTHTQKVASKTPREKSHNAHFQLWFPQKTFRLVYTYKFEGGRGGAVGWGTALQTGR